ncbi:MAG: hypothetical protein LBO73_04215 [Holosporaceae bacterium]|jgi:hypothetical protein|nr:hypothetical protein [Holosporaceae bacterium]
MDTKFAAIVCTFGFLTATESCNAAKFTRTEIEKHLKEGTLGDYIVESHRRDPDVRKLINHIADHLRNPGDINANPQDYRNISGKESHTIIFIADSPNMNTPELKAAYWLKNVLNSGKGKKYSMKNNSLEIEGLTLYNTGMSKTKPTIYELEPLNRQNKRKFIKNELKNNKDLIKFLNTSIVCVLKFADNFTRLNNNPNTAGAPYGDC